MESSTELAPQSTGVPLTESEEKLLDFLAKPESVAMTVTDICKECEITPPTYYRAFKKDSFVRRLQDEAVGLIHSAVMPIIHQAKYQAVSGGKNSHHWAKMVLEMSGLYVPKSAAQVKADVKIVINVPRPEGVTQVIDITPTETST